MHDCQYCHWWRELAGRIVTAMTYFLVLIAALVAVEIVAGVRTLRSGRPAPAAGEPPRLERRAPPRRCPTPLRH